MGADRQWVMYHLSEMGPDPLEASQLDCVSFLARECPASRSCDRAEGPAICLAQGKSIARSRALTTPWDSCRPLSFFHQPIGRGSRRPIGWWKTELSIRCNPRLRCARRLAPLSLGDANVSPAGLCERDTLESSAADQNTNTVTTSLQAYKLT